LEKLRASLLAIGQRRATPEQDTAADCDQTEGNGQIYICQEMFSLLQEQLKEYVAYHHLILEDRQFSVFLFSNNYVLCSVSSKKVWISELTKNTILCRPISSTLYVTIYFVHSFSFASA
jgi:uncharacterized secreted protein with C-terminal beta-propeller domain